jgi:hypothetical protein
MTRDSVKESSWFEHPVIGYVPLDADGNPHRTTRMLYTKQQNLPPRIYQTMGRAVSLSPVKSAAEVRMFQPIEKTS